MNNDVQRLHKEMAAFMAEGNDLADLAGWVLDLFAPEEEEDEEASEEAITEEGEEEAPKKPEKPKAKPKVSRLPFPNLPQTVEGRQLMSPEALAGFQSRAMVNPPKKERIQSLVDEIQGKNPTTYAAPPGLDFDPPVSMDGPMYAGGGDSYIDPKDQQPLSPHELAALQGIESSFKINAPPPTYKEMERLQKLEEMQYGGSVGVISRK